MAVPRNTPPQTETDRQPNPSHSSQTAYTRQDLKQTRWDAFLLALAAAQLLSASITIWLIWQSVEVYVGIGAGLARATVASQVPSWLQWFIHHTYWLGDFVGWLVGSGASLIAIGGMLFLYALLQVGEIAPLLLENSPRTLRRLIATLTQQNRLTITEKDHPTIAFLKERHNLIPTAWVDTIYTAKWIAYGIDFAICLYACPPIQGGWSKLRLVLAAPTLGDFDANNAFRIAITLFAVELGFFVWLWIRRGRHLLSGSH